MAPELSLSQTPGTALRRSVLAEVRATAASLRSGASDAVHEARKHLKKARASLRLLGTVENAPQPSDLRRTLRDIARGLSSRRDWEVVDAWLDDWQSGARVAGERLLASQLRQQLAARHSAGEPPGSVFASALSDLEQVRDRVAALSVEQVTAKSIAANVERTRKRMRKAGRAYARHETAADLHEWRKRSKDLWYQVRLLHPQLRRRLRRLPDRLRTLTDIQGKLHDLRLVRETLLSPSLTPLAPSELDLLNQRLDRERQRRLRQMRPAANEVGKLTDGRCLKRSVVCDR